MQASHDEAEQLGLGTVVPPTGLSLRSGVLPALRLAPFPPAFCGCPLHSTDTGTHHRSNTAAGAGSFRVATGVTPHDQDSAQPGDSATLRSPSQSSLSALLPWTRRALPKAARWRGECRDWGVS